MNQGSFWKHVFSLLGFAACLYFVAATWSVFLPFLMGFVIAYLVTPLIDRLVARGFRRDRIVLVLYGALLLVGSVVFTLLWPSLVNEIRSVAQNVPHYSESLNVFMTHLNAHINTVLTPFVKNSHGPVAIPFDPAHFVQTIVYKIPDNLMNVAHMGVWVLIIPFSCFFALSQGQRWIDVLFDYTPSRYVESLLGFLAEVNTVLGGYVRGVLLESSAVGVLTMLGLFVLGVKGALLLGVVVALLNVVPFLAPVVGGSLALFSAYFQHLPLTTMVGIVCLFVLIRLADDFILIPFILGHTVALHPMVMVFAILAGMKVGGLMGLVFAIPVSAVIKVVLSIIFSDRRGYKQPLSAPIIS